MNMRMNFICELKHCRPQQNFKMIRRCETKKNLNSKYDEHRMRV